MLESFFLQMSSLKLEKLKMQMRGKYPLGCAKELEAMEKLFAFHEFHSEIALKLGGMLVQFAKKYQEDLVVLIVREDDQTIIFQYVGNKKTKRNIEFAMKKRNTVLKTGHSSLWSMAKAMSEGGAEEVFLDECDCLPVGGAFPVYVDKKLVATICVSGLHNGMDHQLIVDALSYYFHTEAPIFHGTLI